MRLGTHQGGTKMVLIMKGWGAGVEDFSHHLSAKAFQAKLSSSDLSLREYHISNAYWICATCMTCQHR